MPDHLDTLKSVQPWWREHVRRQRVPSLYADPLMRFLCDRADRRAEMDRQAHHALVKAAQTRLDPRPYSTYKASST